MSPNIHTKKSRYAKVPIIIKLDNSFSILYVSSNNTSKLSIEEKRKTKAMIIIILKEMNAYFAIFPNMLRSKRVGSVFKSLSFLYIAVASQILSS